MVKTLSASVNCCKSGSALKSKYVTTHAERGRGERGCKVFKSRSVYSGASYHEAVGFSHYFKTHAIYWILYGYGNVGVSVVTRTYRRI